MNMKIDFTPSHPLLSVFVKWESSQYIAAFEWKSTARVLVHEQKAKNIFQTYYGRNNDDDDDDVDGKRQRRRQEQHLLSNDDNDGYTSVIHV